MKNTTNSIFIKGRIWIDTLCSSPSLHNHPARPFQMWRSIHVYHVSRPKDWLNVHSRAQSLSRKLALFKQVLKEQNILAP